MPALRPRPLAASLALGLLLACGGVRLPDPPKLFPARKLWSAPLGAALLGVPVADAERVFVSARDGSTRGLRAETGETAWRVEQRSGALALGPRGLLVRETDGTLWSVDPASGDARWKTRTGVSGTWPAVVDGDTALVAGQGIVAVSLAKGRLLWGAADGTVAAAAPTASGGRIYVAEADGTVRCRDGQTGATLWTHPTAGPLLASPVVDERGRVYVGTTDGRFLALQAKDGKQDWSWKVGADVPAPAALVGARVLFASFEAVLYALGRGNGHLLWRSVLPSRPLGGPVLAGTAALVFCHERDVVGFDGRTGKKLGAIDVGGELQAPPVVFGDRLYAPLRNRSLVAWHLGVAPEPSPSPSGPPPSPGASPAPGGSPPSSPAPSPAPSAPLPSPSPAATAGA